MVGALVMPTAAHPSPAHSTCKEHLPDPAAADVHDDNAEQLRKASGPLPAVSER